MRMRAVFRGGGGARENGRKWQMTGNGRHNLKWVQLDSAAYSSSSPREAARKLINARINSGEITSEY